MARETKVGLLVGMGFIVCFAIILSNRGRERPLATHSSLAVLAGASDVSTPQSLAGAERRVRDLARTGRARPEPSMPDTVAPPMPSERVDLDAGDALPSEAFFPRPIASSDDEAVVQDAVERLTASLESEADALQPIEPEPAALPAAEGAERPETELAARVNSSPSSYVVRQGDSLSKIALAAYGSQRKDVVEAIFQANRKKLKNRNSIMAGQTLVLPDISGTRTSGGDAGHPSAAAGQPREQPAVPCQCEPAARKAQKPPASAKPSWRWYQVKRGDKYATIAERQLGNRSRWKEIHELNKKKFPNPSHIQWGVRIKIPADAPDDSKGRSA